MAARILSDDERIDWLQLIRSDGIGPMTFYQLLRRFGTATAALEALPSLDVGRRRFQMIPRGPVIKEYELGARLGASWVAACEPAYPSGLRAIADPPPVIAVRGPVSLDRPSLAIVGARNASAIGKRLATDLARDLGDQGYAIVSGLARGIDGAAHAAALRTGTIAVVAGGVDQIYPPEHQALYQMIVGEGAVVSEVPVGHVARAQDFPKRNRIVAGLSLGVIVVEAADRSGTLITARLAAEQGREVFAVPGSPLDPRASGTNRLIRQGATLIRHADDVIDELRRIPPVAQGNFTFEEPPAPFDPNDRDELRHLVLTALTYCPTHRDQLVRETSMTSDQLADILLDLVLDGAVDEVSGGSYTLSAPSDASRADI